MLRRSVSVSLRPRDILKLTFLFLATFVQARLLPAQAEKALRACTQCRKSAQGADLTSFVKCSAQRAQCNASRVPCTVHRVLCRVSFALCSASSGKWDVSIAARIAHPAQCTASRAPRVAFRASRALVDAECSTSFGKSIAQPGSRRLSPAPRCLVAAKRTTANASCPPHHASRLPLDADAPRG